MPKEPGFILHERPIVGRAILVQGVEVKCPGSGNILDYYVDLKDREAALAGLRWLNSKQVKLERSIQRQAAIDFAHAHRNDTDYLLVRGPLEPLLSDKAATCFACGKHHAAMCVG